MDLFSWALIMVLCDADKCDPPQVVAMSHSQEHCETLAGFYGLTTVIPAGYEMTFVCPPPKEADHE